MDFLSSLPSTAVRLIKLPPDASKIFLPDLAEFLANRYKFVGKPTKVEDFTANGLSLAYGKFNETKVDTCTFFSDGIACQGTALTNVLQEFLSDVEESVSERFGIPISEPTSSWLFDSHVEVLLRPGFSKFLAAAEPIAELLRTAITGYGIDVSAYQPQGFTCGGDGDGVVKPGRFVIERRVNRHLAENVFYSEAPLSSIEHLALLDKLESLF